MRATMLLSASLIANAIAVPQLGIHWKDPATSAFLVVAFAVALICDLIELVKP